MDWTIKEKLREYSCKNETEYEIRMIKMKVKRSYQILLPFLIVGALFGVMLWKAGIFFETNDDRIITEILTGSMTGQPENTPYYINFLLSAPLALLYRIEGIIPWYGIFLLLLHGLALLLIFVSIYRKCETLRDILCSTLLCLGVVLADIYMLGLIQYTSTAVLAAIAGYVCYALHPRTKWGLASFGILELGAYLLRAQAMLMIQPIGMVLLVTLVFATENYRNRQTWIQTGKIVGTVVIVLIIGCAGNKLGYSSAQWKEYQEYNEARAELFDYYGTPEYEEVQDILDKYQVTEAQYNAYRKYVLLYPHVSTQCQKELVEFQKAKQNHSFSPSQFVNLIGRTFQVCLKGYYFRMNLFVFCVYGLVILWILLSRKWSLLLPMAGMGCSWGMVCGYLVWGGRYPYRVMMPLFWCLALFSMTVMIKEFPITEVSLPGKFRIQKGCLILVCLCIAVGGYLTGSQQYLQVSTANRQQALMIQGREQVKEYCLKHPEEKYILDTASFSDYKGSALETGIYGTQNSIYTGSWHSGSPALYTYQQEYLQGYEKNFSLIINDTGEELSQQLENAVTGYFTEMLGTEPMLEDRFTVPHGSSYLVWHYCAE